VAEPHPPAHAYGTAPPRPSPARIQRRPKRARVQLQVKQPTSPLIVMTSAGEESEWVSRELARAQQKACTIVPLVLDGKVFFPVGNLNYHDVAEGSMPDERQIDELRPGSMAAKDRRQLALLSVQPVAGTYRPIRRTLGRVATLLFVPIVTFLA